MADDDLTTIQGLGTRHRQVLIEKLQVTNYEELASADPEAIFEAMVRIRPRPTLQRIRLWKEQARRLRGQAVVEDPGWERAATFVLSFEQRQVESSQERRLVIQQTELELEQPWSSWPDWDCSAICDWLRQRVGGSKPVGPVDAPEPADERTAGAGQLQIVHAAVVDLTERREAVAEGRSTGQSLECTIPCRLEVAVAGVPPDREVRVALRFRRVGQAGWSPLEPATLAPHGRVELELPDAVAGRHAARLVAWVPDGSTPPTAVDLPELTIRAPEEP